MVNHQEEKGKCNFKTTVLVQCLEAEARLCSFTEFTTINHMGDLYWERPRPFFY